MQNAQIGIQKNKRRLSTKANKKAINNVKVDEGTLKASHSKNQLDLGGTKEPTATVEMSYLICSDST